MSQTFRIGTRASRMAMAQSEAVRAALQARFPEHRFELVNRPAAADLDTKSRLGALGGKGGAFIQSMREMMDRGEADMAMHSLKDLPGNDEYYGDDTYAIGACLARDDASDALVMKTGLTFDPVSPPAVIGTSSIRRRAFLRRLFPQSEVVAFRGSADLRLSRLDAGIAMEFNYGGTTAVPQALVLASNGLARIGFADRISHVFPDGDMCPAVGQGVVVVEYPTASSVLLPVVSSRCPSIFERPIRMIARMRACRFSAATPVRPSCVSTGATRSAIGSSEYWMPMRSAASSASDRE